MFFSGKKNFIVSQNWGPEALIIFVILSTDKTPERLHRDIRRLNLHLISRGLDLHLRGRKTNIVAIKQSNKK